MFIVLERCPHCKGNSDGYASKMLGISSGLGSPRLQCGKCGHVFVSNRTEWKEMNLFDRLWYVGVSAVYAAFIGYGSGLLAGFVWENFTKGPRTEVNAPWWAFDAGLVGGATGVVLFQVWRIIASLKRSNKRKTKKYLKAHFFSIHLNMQTLSVLFLLGVGCLSFAISSVIDIVNAWGK
jgi:hypothetical protein